MTSDSITEQAARAELQRHQFRTFDALSADDPGLHGCYCGEWQGYWADYHAHVARALADAGLLAHQAPATEHERDMTRLIEERDSLHDVADALAARIAPPEVLGEHSSANDPWQNALDYAPATEDEAAEVEWAVRDSIGLIMPMPDERHARYAHENSTRPWSLIQRTPNGPWREVSS